MPGGEYDGSHIVRLERMVLDRLAADFRFHHITFSERPGWWAKIDLFRPGRFTGRVLYLDLDVTVVGPLDDLVAFPAEFAIIRDWNTGNFNSSVMAWDAGVADRIFTKFTPDVMNRYKGDQGWIHECMPNAATFPRAWCKSYKKHIAPRIGRNPPEDCRIICWHGRPKPWDLPADHKDVIYA